MTNAVVIRFGGPLLGKMMVVVRDLVTETPIIIGGLREIAAWLKDNGFTWETGSNGVWSR